MLFRTESSRRRARGPHTPATRARRARFGPRLERLEDRIVLDSDSWIATGSVGAWSDVNNWSLGQLPGPSDTAIFSGSTSSAACVVDVPATIDSLQVASDYTGFFTLDSPLTLTGDSQIQAPGYCSFTIAPGSSLTNDGTLTVALTGDLMVQTFTIAPGSSLTNDGTLTVALPSNQTLLIGGGGVVTNDGTVVSTGTQPAAIELDGTGTTLNNNAGASFELSGDTNLDGSVGTVINNAGTISKTAGTGTSGVYTDTFNNNGGTLGTSSGTLIINPGQGSSSGGAFTADTGCVLYLDPSRFTYTGTYTGSGSGTVAIYANDILEIGPGGATFDFPAGLFHWNGTVDVTHGNLTNAGSLTADYYQAGAAVLTGTGQLINNGTINLAGNAPRLAIAGNATLVNASGGSINIKSGSAIIGSESGSDGTLDNAGTLRMSAGAGTTSWVNANLDSSGTIDVASGTLRPRGTCKFTGGTFTVASGASLLIDSSSLANTFTGSFTGSGGGTVSLGSFSVGTGGATVNFPGGMLQWLDTTINTASGALTNDGTITIPSGGGGGEVVLDGGGTLINNGKIIHLGFPLVLDHGSTLSNMSKGVYNMEGSTAIQCTGSGSFINAGLLSETSSAGASIWTAFSNTGRLQVSAGTLAISGTIAQDVGGTLNGGSWSVLGTTKSPATLEFALPNLTTIGTKASVTLSGPNATFTNLAGLATNQGSFSLLGGRSFATPGGFTNSGNLTLSPGSVLTVNGHFTQTSAGKLAIKIGGTSASPRIGSILATGTVTLAGGLTVTATVKPAVGTALVVVNNQGPSPISGIFAHLPEGATIKVNGMTFRISYVGGSNGRSVTLTRIA
jgi:hypothetical protein